MLYWEISNKAYIPGGDCRASGQPVERIHSALTPCYIRSIVEVVIPQFDSLPRPLSVTISTTKDKSVEPVSDY